MMESLHSCLLSVLNQAMQGAVMVEQLFTSQLDVDMTSSWRDCLHTILP